MARHQDDPYALSDAFRGDNDANRYAFDLTFTYKNTVNQYSG